MIEDTHYKDDLYIQYNDFYQKTCGKMLIHMNQFFPANLGKFKQLLKIINLDWQNKNGLKEKMKVHIQKRISESEVNYSRFEQEYQENKQRVSNLQQQMKSKKSANGVPLSKSDLKSMRYDTKNFREWARNALSGMKMYKKEKENYQKYLGLL